MAEVCQIDNELQTAGGGARFDMDDGYLYGPAEHVFPAMLRFAARMHSLGLELQLHKCKCFSPQTDLQHHPARPPTVLVGECMAQDGPAKGVVVSGIPIGEARFVTHHLSSKVEEMVSMITEICTKLRGRHLQALWAVMYHCLQSKFHYWVQHCPPAVVQPAAHRFDQALLDVAQICVSTGIASDPIALRRLRLPARMYGGGLRSVEDVAPAAFMATICRAVPLMADRIEDNRRLAGFVPALTQALGVAENEGHNHPLRVHAFSQLASLLSVAFLRSWQFLQAEVGNYAEDTFQDIFTKAAQRRTGVQHAITVWREKARFQALDVEIRALPSADFRKSAWINTDKFSTVWVSAWPSEDFQFSNPEFREVSTFYYGLPSPACASQVGEAISNLRVTLDPHGTRLTTAHLPGDGWRTQHDAIKWRIVQDAREMHFRCRHEVFGLFAACIPQASRHQTNGLSIRKRQGLVPDFLLHAAFDGPERPLLFELKTLHYGSSTYGNEANRCNAVARRARALPAEYRAKARPTDAQYCGTASGDVGPVQSKLNTFEPVRGIVFGAWGEASPDTAKLLTLMAQTGAQRHWRGMRCEDPVHATGIMAWLLRRRWGLTMLRKNARLKLDRLEYVGRGAVTATMRRANALDAQAARVRAVAGSLMSGPRVRASIRP